MDITLAKLGMLAVYGIMVLTVTAALGVVLARNLFHAALALALVLIGTAAVFISLHAEFLAMVQILIYVGAVMTLIIFAIMLTGKLSDKSVEQTNKQSLPAFLAVAFFSMISVMIVWQTPWPMQAAALWQPVSVTDLGRALLGEYVFPFEVISVILIAALIGALTIAKKDS